MKLATGGWLFLKAEGMNRVRRFDDWDAAFRFALKQIVSHRGRYHSNTMLVGAGCPPLNRKAQHDFHAAMTEMPAKDAAIWIAQRAIAKREREKAEAK